MEKKRMWFVDVISAMSSNSTFYFAQKYTSAVPVHQHHDLTSARRAHNGLPDKLSDYLPPRIPRTERRPS